MLAKAEDDFKITNSFLSYIVPERPLPKRLWRLWYEVIVPVDTFESFYVCAYFFGSLYGSWDARNRFIFAAHLMDVCRRAQVLRTVISVVSDKAEQLLVTLGLGAIVVYLYSVIGFLFLHGEYDIDGKNECYYLSECFLIHLDYGFRSAPTYGGDGPPLRCTGDSECGYSVLENYAPFIFDFTYYLLVILVSHPHHRLARALPAKACASESSVSRALLRSVC